VRYGDYLVAAGALDARHGHAHRCPRRGRRPARASTTAMRMLAARAVREGCHDSGRAYGDGAWRPHGRASTAAQVSDRAITTAAAWLTSLTARNVEPLEGVPRARRHAAKR
jgi:hypothetical protein